MKYQWFWNQREAVVNPLLMVWNLQEVAVKPFAHFSNEILMVLNSQEAAVKPFAPFLMKYLYFDETLMIFRSWLAKKFAPPVAPTWRPVAVARGPHRKPLQL